MRIVFAFFCELFIICGLFAQKQQFYYEHYTTEDGLVYDEILYAHIDNDGFIWLATAAGLQCIESYSFKEYYFDSNDSTSISDNFITSIFEDREGKLWIGTSRDGLNVHDKEYGNFFTYKYNSADSNSISSDVIPRASKVITQDVDGYLWVNTDKSLNKINTSNKSVQRHYGNYKGEIIYDDDEHVLWIASDFLKKFNIKTGKLDSYNFDKTSAHHFNSIKSIILDDEGLVWLGTDRGVAIFDKTQNTFYTLENFLKRKGIKNDLRFAWANQSINSVYQDLHSNIWIAIEKVIYIINKKDGKFRILKHENENKNSLLDGSIDAIYGSQTGSVLVAYIRQGITIVDINIKDFRHLQNIQDNPKSISSNAVRSIVKDKRNNLWIGMYDHGLNFIPDQNIENISHNIFDPDDVNTINSNYITAIFIDNDERLWVGTYEDGYCYADDIYNTAHLKFTRSEFSGKKEIHEFLQDHNNRIWISTNTGFYIYDKQKNRHIHYGDSINQVKKVQDLNIQSVIMEAPNTFWLATWNQGVCKLVVNSDSLLTPTISKDSLIIYNDLDEAVLAGLDNRFITILRGKNNVFWLGSNVNGLVKMVETEGELKFTKYDVSSGAPSNSVYGIEEDKNGNIWVSTTKGIGKFVPDKEQFFNYYVSDGVQSNSFSWDSHFKSADGEMFFGGINGLTSFYPEDIEDDTTLVKAYISKLIINHNEIETGQKVNNRIILEKDIRFTDMLSLSHRESIFSLEFGVLNNHNPSELIFSYILEGYDEDWININSEKRTATYTNLNDGTYYFKVRASKQIGSWGSPSTLEIIVIPPWWKTWWAFSLYLLIFILLLYLLQQQLVNRAELKHSLELEQYKHERDNELNQEKFRFFTNLSHEFRTPLTLILGPLDKMIRNNEGNFRVHQKHQLIQKQSLKLLRLTNQLMNFRKYEIDNLKLRSAEGNIIDFLDEIAIAFRNQARTREIHFHFIAKEKEIKMWFDRDKFEIILANLLSNAFKFTPKNGAINLRVKQTDSKRVIDIKQNCSKNEYACYGELPNNVTDLLQIELEDTGCGIKSDQLKYIFERYFQASNLQSISIGGTGIGLEITKNYVELHHGSIMVHSQEGKGSTFYIWIPLGKYHLKPENIIHDFKSSEDIDHYSINGDSLKSEDIDDDPVNQGTDNDEKPKLLVIDDNHGILLFLKTIFENNYKVETASNGKEAMDKAFNIIPDLIITDIMMPEIDGLELCRRVKNDIRTSHIPVVLLTARTSNLFQTEGLETGADDYVTKLFDERVLALKVKNLIASRTSLRKKYSNEITLKPKDITITQSDEKFLDDIIEIIEKHISDSNLKIENIALQIGMSHSVLYRKVNALTDLSLIEFIRTIRLKRASQLFSKTSISVSQASFEVGFTDPKYFSKSFQKYFGVTPSQYISANRQIT